MTKRRLAEEIAGEMNLTRVATKTIVQRVLDYLVEQIEKTGRVELRNFGIFEVRLRGERKARNPVSGKMLLIPARRVLVFKPGKALAARAARAPLPPPQYRRRPAAAAPPPAAGQQAAT